MKGTCMYKCEDFCKEGGMKINLIEKEFDFKCCESCPWEYVVYTGKDKWNLFEEKYKEICKEYDRKLFAKTLMYKKHEHLKFLNCIPSKISFKNKYKDLAGWYFTYGHSSEAADDCDSICYDAIHYYLYKKKKYKYMNQYTLEHMKELIEEYNKCKDSL